MRQSWCVDICCYRPLRQACADRVCVLMLFQDLLRQAAAVSTKAMKRGFIDAMEVKCGRPQTSELCAATVASRA
jgi:hypothetical protein